MGSLVVKLDEPTVGRLKNAHHYSDVDVLGFRATRKVVDPDNHSSSGLEVYDVPMVYDVEAVKQSIRNILMWRVGESVIRPEFGHKLNLSMYQQLNQFNKDKVCEEIKRAIEENEPRVVVNAVAAELDPDNDDQNTLKVKVIYKVVGSKTEDAELVEEARILGK